MGPNLPGAAAREVDATGKIVTPGWVDVHTHFDAQVCWDPYFAPAPHNGATTVIFGNCGVGFAPMKQTSDTVSYICNLMEGVEEIPTPDLLAGLPPAWEDAALGGRVGRRRRDAPAVARGEERRRRAGGRRRRRGCASRRVGRGEEEGAVAAKGARVAAARRSRRAGREPRAAARRVSVWSRRMFSRGDDRDP